MRRLAALALLVACGHPAASRRAPIDNGAGAPACAATIRNVADPGVVYDGWLAAWNGLVAPHAEYYADPATPADDAGARAALCGDDGCDDDGPWVVTTGDDGEQDLHLLAPAPGGRLRAWPDLGTGMGGRCPWTDDVTVVDGDPVQVTVVDEPNEEMWVNDDGRCEDFADDCSTACFYTGKSERDLFVDLTAGAIVLEIDRDEVGDPDVGEFLLDESFHQPVTLTRDAAGVTLAGAGCDQTIPLR